MYGHIALFSLSWVGMKTMAKSIAVERLRWIKPILDKEISIKQMSKVCPFSERTIKYWLAAFREKGSKGLEPKSTRPRTKICTGATCARICTGGTCADLGLLKSADFSALFASFGIQSILLWHLSLSFLASLSIFFGIQYCLLLEVFIFFGIIGRKLKKRGERRNSKIRYFRNRLLFLFYIHFRILPDKISILRIHCRH